jgi:hypothetical protein
LRSLNSDYATTLLYGNARSSADAALNLWGYFMNGERALVEIDLTRL